MCAILGGTEKNWSYEKAINVMKHRGPDAQKVIEGADFNMAFARLSIIDLSMNAMQPMLSSDGNISLVFNGEIYGFKNLRNQLEKLGHRFNTSSDTEVILESYIEWGESFIHHIDGMFAIAIFDRTIGKVFLFRDRPGIKPLYYYYDGRRFAFASELKGIECLCNDCRLSIDYSAIYDFLYYQYIPAPKTMYKQVFKLEQASKLTFDIKTKQLTVGRYWEIKINSKVKDSLFKPDEVRFNLRNLIKESVKKQIVSDVPVATFLSGGIDSSIITAEVSLLDKTVSGFAMGFKEISLDETKYAKIVAEHLGINHIRYELNEEECGLLYRDFKNWFDEPFADSTGWPNYVISREIRKVATVALSGDGGDELFGGYPRYAIFSEMTNESRLNSRAISDWYIKKLGWNKYLPLKTNRFFYDDVVLFANVGGYIPESRCRRNDALIRKKLGIDKDYDPYWHFRKYYNKELPKMTMAHSLEFQTYLPDCLLPKVDRTSMAVSLETRVPFLDKDVVEYVFSLPESVRCTVTESKKVLKETYKGILPDEILYRKKKGFTAPTNYYKKGEMGFKESALRDLWKIKVM